MEVMVDRAADYQITELMNYDWCGKESDISFEKVRHVIDIIHQNFCGDSSVHVGIIYIAIGCNAGKLTERYLMFVPYYNPSVNGYNFNIQHPYIFARGFLGRFL